MKINSSGALQWVRWIRNILYIVGVRRGSYGYDVQITSDSGFVVDYSIIVKTNSSGDVQWYRVWGGPKRMLSIPLFKRPMAVS